MGLWFITIMNYQVNAYYPNYFPGDQYLNLVAISTVELFAYIISALAFDWFRGRQTTKLFLFSFTFCLLGSAGIIFGNPTNMQYLDLISNFIVKFGIASAYQAVYMTSILFPIVYSSSTFGICCMQGAIAGMISSHVYALDGLLPWYIFIILCIVGILFAVTLRDK